MRNAFQVYLLQLPPLRFPGERDIRSTPERIGLLPQLIETTPPSPCGRGKSPARSPAIAVNSHPSVYQFNLTHPPAPHDNASDRALFYRALKEDTRGFMTLAYNARRSGEREGGRIAAGANSNSTGHAPSRANPVRTLLPPASFRPLLLPPHPSPATLSLRAA